MSSEKILIIEDEENILEAVKYSLNQEGYDVFTSMDGEEGLEKAQEIRFWKNCGVMNILGTLEP